MDAPSSPKRKPQSTPKPQAKAKLQPHPQPESKFNRRLVLPVVGGVLVIAVISGLVYALRPKAAQQPPISDDFEGEIVKGIGSYAGTWQILDDGTGNHVFQNEPLNDWPGFSIGPTMTDGVIQYRVKYLEFDLSSDTGSGRVDLSFRSKGTNDGYVFSLFPYRNRTEVQYIGADGKWFAPLPGSMSTVSFQKGVWYTVRLRLAGSAISTYLNGTLLSTVADERSKAGDVVLGTGPNTQVQFDDISIVYGTP